MLSNLPWTFCSLVALLVFLLLPASSPGIEIAPFATRNQNPLVQIYGIPTAEPGRLLDRGRFSARLTLDIANSYASDKAKSEEVLLDGETYHSNLGLRYGVGDRLQIGLDIPFISHSGGFLDGFIEGWHDTFHLPQGGREQAPRERLAYSYRRDGQPLVDLTDSTAGFGDLRLSGAWQLLRASAARPGAVALHLSLKLPTGDSDKLLGSGSSDLALSLSGQRDVPIRMGRIAAFASFGTLLMTDGDVLPEQRRNLAGFGSVGLGWAPHERLALQLQIDGHSALYKDSRLQEIDANSLQLVLGGSVQLAERTVLDLAVSEDIVVDTAPDVVFHLSLHRIF